jgi:dTDP-4-dehydrorhamnose reductase
VKILIIGADGQLGVDLCKTIPQEQQIPLTIKDLDITRPDQTSAVLKKYLPQVVINTAAYHRVDDCEDHAAEAFAVNAIGSQNVARACREIDAALVYISTDYVFEGNKNSPYVETDIPNPQSLYGISKLTGEYCVKYLLAKYFIVRTTGLYGVAGSLGKGGVNFVENMIERAGRQAEVRVVKDEILSPTYTIDLAAKIYELIQTNHFGLLHLVNSGECSWYDFTLKIFELLDRKVKIIPVTAAEFKTKARRPSYSVLQSARLETLGKNNLRPWPQALRAYLIEKGHLLSA